MKKYLSLVVLITLVLVPSLALAQLSLGNSYMNDFATGAGYGPATLTEVVGRIIKVVLSLLGLVAVVLIIVGGFQWMASGGNEEKIKEAKKLMGAALAGLIIIILAYAIATFIISNLTNVTN